FALLFSSFFFFLPLPPLPFSTLFPYTTLFRSHFRFGFFRRAARCGILCVVERGHAQAAFGDPGPVGLDLPRQARGVSRTHVGVRSEEHTSELQSLRHLVCRLLLEKKKKKKHKK